MMMTMKKENQNISIMMILPLIGILCCAYYYYFFVISGGYPPLTITLIINNLNCLDDCISNYLGPSRTSSQLIEFAWN